MAYDFGVTVGADIKQYKDSLKEAEALGKSTGNSITKSLGAAASASTAMGGSVAKGAKQANNALTSLSRIVQDAPFGWVGIQNNVTEAQLTFSRLKQETGSTGAALKALGGSLIGAGGVGLAFSIVTSAITLYTMWSQRSKKATDEASGAIDTYAKALKDSSESGAKEISQLTTLYNAAKNSNLAYSDRIKAVKELKNEYPEYFKNLSDEAILVGKAQSAYEELTKTMIGRAAIAAATSQLETAMKPLINEAIKAASNEAQNPRKNAKEVMENIKKGVLKENGLVIPIDSFKFDNGKASRDNTNPIATEAQKAADVQSRIRETQEAEVKKWQDTIQQLIQKFGTDTITHAGGKGKNAFELLEEQVKELERTLQGAVASGQSNTVIDNIAYKLSEATSKLEIFKDAIEKAKTIGNDTTLTGAFSGVGEIANILKNTGADVVYKTIADNQYLLTLKTREYNEEVQRQNSNLQFLVNTIGGGLTGAFQSALSGSQSFFQAMGSFLTGLISRLVAAALAAAALAALLSFTGLGALVGVSGGFSSLTSGIFGSLSGLKLAQGGITTGPTRALIGEGREKEAVMPLSKLQAFVNNNGGGANNTLKTKISGSDLLIWQERAQQTKNRIG